MSERTHQRHGESSRSSHRLDMARVVENSHDRYESRHSGREEGRREKVRYRSRSRTRSTSPHSHAHKGRRRRARSESESSSSSSSDSEDERRRRKKEKRRKEEKEGRRRKKEKKKAKRDKATAAVTAQWGKYGLISETDINKKDSEFRTWLVEERKINPETITKEKTRKEFAVFVEDYNTATLSHEKFYDIGKYEYKMNLIRSGQTIPDEAYDPSADMKAHTSLLKSQYKEKETYLSREEISELRRIESERIQIGKRRVLGLDVPRNMGVRTEEVPAMSFD